jgi:two-component system sensor histidine kinase MprB
MVGVAIVTALVAFAVAIVALQMIEHSDAANTDRELRRASDRMVPMISRGALTGIESDADMPMRGGDRFRQPGPQEGTPMLVQVSRNGAVVTRNGVASDFGGLPAPEEVRAEGRLRTVESNGVVLRVFERPAGDFVLQVARVEDASDDLLERVAVGFAILALLAACCAALLGRWAAGSVLRPIGKMAATARRIRDTGDLSQRVDSDASDPEMQDLAISLNEMLGSIDEARKLQLAFVADASHEMNTPLTGLRGNATYLTDSLKKLGAGERVDTTEIDAAAASIVRDVDRVAHLAKSLSELATLDADRNGSSESFDLTSLVDDEVDRARATYPHHVFDIAGPSDPVFVANDPELVRRIVANLVANGGVHTPTGSTVTTSIAQTRDGATVTVADNGPGVSAAARPHLFDRFYRAPGSQDRPGSGIGLSIVARSVDLIGGSLRVEDTTSGGLRIVVDIPDVQAAR